MAKKTYLDYAAATPLDKEVFLAMKPFFAGRFHNPSATYLAGRAAKASLNGAREKVATTIGAKPGEIIFTSGATEANNLAIRGIMQDLPDGEMLVSSIEHESVQAPTKLFKHKLIPVNREGVIDLNFVSKNITEKTALISVMLVNNEIGSVQPLAELAKVVKETRTQRLKKGIKIPIYLHTDAAQAGGVLDLHVARLGVDLMTINGGKIYGPKQSGLLFVKAGIKLKPLILGGGQEFGLRSGTENVANFVGLAKALEIAQANRRKNSGRLANLRVDLAQRLTQAIPSATINGSSKNQAPHILSVTFAGIDNERLMMQLDQAGFEVAVGSACSASSDLPSHVLSAIGLSAREARSTIRISFGKTTKIKDLKKFMSVLHGLLLT